MHKRSKSAAVNRPPFWHPTAASFSAPCPGWCRRQDRPSWTSLRRGSKIRTPVRTQVDETAETKRAGLPLSRRPADSPLPRRRRRRGRSLSLPLAPLPPTCFWLSDTSTGTDALQRAAIAAQARCGAQPATLVTSARPCRQQRPCCTANSDYVSCKPHGLIDRDQCSPSQIMALAPDRPASRNVPPRGWLAAAHSSRNPSLEP